ncbi:MAG: hypothetical protein QM817_33460 [Archangium sp.]
MSAAREELEQAQARIKEIEARMISELQLQLLADQLEREADSWEKTLDRGEKRKLREDTTSPGARVMAFGFALLAVTPVVAMVGISLSRMMRHEFELAWALLVLGILVVVVTSLPIARRAIAHRFSRAWKLSREARLEAASLRAML